MYREPTRVRWGRVEEETVLCFVSGQVAERAPPEWDARDGMRGAGAPGRGETGGVMGGSRFRCAGRA